MEMKVIKNTDERETSPKSYQQSRLTRDYRSKEIKKNCQESTLAKYNLAKYNLENFQENPDFNKYFLSVSELTSYYEQGYVVKVSSYSSEELQKISNSLEELAINSLNLYKNISNNKAHNKGFTYNNFSYGGSDYIRLYKANTEYVLKKSGENLDIRSIDWAQGDDYSLNPYKPSILFPVAQILEQETFDHLISKAHIKSPNSTIDYPWHLDIQSRELMCDGNGWNATTHKSGDYVLVFLAIDNHTLDNGPLNVYPGTHKTRLDIKRYSSTEELPESIKSSQPIALNITAGTMVFIHPYLLHGSFINESDNLRKTLLYGFSIPGVNNCTYPGADSGKTIKFTEGLDLDYYSLLGESSIISEIKTCTFNNMLNTLID